MKSKKIIVCKKSSNIDNEIIKKLYKTIENVCSMNEKILDKVNNLEKEIEKIYKKQELLNSKIKDNKNENIIELKVEDINLDKDLIIKNLNYADHRSIIQLMKKYYLNNNKSYPIKCNGKHKFEYYYNNKWNEDIYGYKIVEIIFKNFEKLFLKNNVMNETIDTSKFLKNQEFIFSLGTEKKKREFIRYLRAEINSV